MGGYTQTTIRDINGNIIGYKPVTESDPFVSGGVVDRSNSLYNQLLGQYNQQHFANVSSSGVVLNQTYQPTRNPGSYADNAVGIVQQVSAGGGQVGQNLIDKYNIGKPSPWESPKGGVYDGQPFQSIPFYAKPNLYVAPVERGVIPPIGKPTVTPTTIDTYFTRGGEPRPNTNPGRFGATYVPPTQQIESQNRDNIGINIIPITKSPVINPVSNQPLNIFSKDWNSSGQSVFSKNWTPNKDWNPSLSFSTNSTNPAFINPTFINPTPNYGQVDYNKKIDELSGDLSDWWSGVQSRPDRIKPTKSVGSFGGKHEPRTHNSHKSVRKETTRHKQLTESDIMKEMGLIHVSNQKSKKGVSKKPTSKKHEGMFWGI